VVGCRRWHHCAFGLGWGYLQALRVERGTLQPLIADCEKPINPPLPKDSFDADLKRICDPKELRDLSVKSPLVGDQAKIVDLAMEADEDRASGRFRALVVFLIFCVPLVWYFLLDRLKEVSAAIRKP
jgi:hypothetical protein